MRGDKIMKLGKGSRRAKRRQEKTRRDKRGLIEAAVRAGVLDVI
jgi:hypothetical protein